MGSRMKTNYCLIPANLISLASSWGCRQVFLVMGDEKS